MDLLISQEEFNLTRLEEINRKAEEDISSKIEMAKTEIGKLEEENKTYQIGIDKIQKYKNTKIDIQAKIDQLNLKISELNSQIRQKENVIATNEGKISSVKRKAEFYKQNCADCPKVAELLKQDNLAEITQDNLDRQEEITTIKGWIAPIEINIKKYKEDIEKCDGYISRESGFKTVIQNNNRRIQELKSFMAQEKKAIVQIDRSKLQGYIDSKAQISSTIDQKTNDKAHYAFTRTMLSDDAIKAFVVKKYLPVINKILNSYLQKFGSDVIFNFTPEFEEEIVSRYKESFSYESFSEGQKRRIDLAILFTFMEFCKIKFAQASTNLMILDEISAGLDSIGENILYELLKDMKQNKTILTISHSEVINPEYIDHRYKATIKQGFSNLARISS